MKRPTLAECLWAIGVAALVAACTTRQQQNAQTALEAAEAACVIARAATADDRAHAACLALDILRAAAERALDTPDGGSDAL